MARGHGPRTPGIRILALSIEWLVWLGAWILLAGPGPAEWVIGGMGAALAVAATRSVRHEGSERLGRPARRLLQLRFVPWEVVRGTVTVTRALATRVFTGRLPESRIVAVQLGTPDEVERDAALRALAITMPALSPNFVPIGVDRKRGRLVFHQLRSEPPPSALTRLVAEK